MAAPVRVAVVGAGWASELHLEGFGRSPDVELTALSSRTRGSAEKMAARYSIESVYTDTDEMLSAEKPDIVSIATPPSSHRELVLKALSMGCHVLCDKPLAMTAAEAAEMNQEADSRGLRHATGFIWRNDPAILRLRSLLAEGFIGEVRDIHCKCAPGSPPLPMTWMYDRAAGGGALMQHGCHVVDRARWVLSDEIVELSGELLFDLKEAVVGPRFESVQEAFGWAGRQMGQPTEGLPTAEVTADTGYAFSALFASGVRGHFWESWHSFGAVPDQLEVYGSRGTLIWAGAEGLTLIRPRKAPGPIAVEGGTSEAGSGDLNKESLKQVGFMLWAKLAQSFLDDILGRPHDPYPTLYDGLRVQQVIDAVASSTSSRTWESCA